MSTGQAVAVALVFVWLGMVLAISFLEAPLKFRAPGITIPLGLGIGRLVFRALNLVEGLLAVGGLVCLALDPPRHAVTAGLVAAVVCLLAQVVLVRPALTGRTDAVLAGEAGTGSHAHLVYIGLEVVKVALLLATGVLLLRG